MILAIRTDQAEAHLYLLDADGTQTAHYSWLADRQLANTLLKTLLTFIADNNIMPKQLTGIAVFTGAGSFTGLRIGTTVANAIAYQLGIPVIALEGEDWLAHVSAKLTSTEPGHYATPTYDREPNITKPKQAQPKPD